MSGFTVSSDGKRCIGDIAVPTWTCMNVPTAYPWDTTLSRCTSDGNCKAGPFLVNGHLDYENMQCNDSWPPLSLHSFLFLFSFTFPLFLF